MFTNEARIAQMTKTYAALTVRELRAYAGHKNVAIKGRHGMRKADLVAAIMQVWTAQHNAQLATVATFRQQGMQEMDNEEMAETARQIGAYRTAQQS